MLRPFFVAFAGVLAFLPALATAALVSVDFNGSVTGRLFDPSALPDFPNGTSAAFDVTFDASSLTPTIGATFPDIHPISGELSLGTQVWQLDDGGVTSIAFNGNEITTYGFQFTGTGPSVTNNTGGFFGLFFALTPDLQIVPNANVEAGFGFPFDGGVNFQYALLSGQFQVSQVPSQVPEPSTLALLGAGFAGLGFFGFSRRKRAK